jgi:hypothetical protein
MSARAPGPAWGGGVPRPPWACVQA